MNNDEVIQRLIPYRMHAVSTLNTALKLRRRWTDAPPMTIHVDGQLVVEGNLNAFTNPAIEAGLMHGRALLEFLGLCDRGGVLSNIDSKQRRKGDVGIEQFSNADGPLKMVEPEVALSRYEGSREDAEKALLSVLHITNKGLAHTTRDLVDDPEHAERLEVASRGIPALVVSYLYTPLDLPAPNYKIPTRSMET